MATREQVYEFARQEAQRQGVPYSLVQKIVETESKGDFNAIGPKTRFNDRAYGPMQLMALLLKILVLTAWIGKITSEVVLSI